MIDMSYKYLDYEREKELIHVLCGDYDLGRDEGWIDCYDTYKEEIEGFDYGWKDCK